MANPIWTLTGGMFQAGSAINNTQTDTFNIFGLSNVVLEQFGNLLANGGNGAGFGSTWDSNTTITIGGSGVTDNITLDGGANSVSGTVSNSTVTYTVTSLNGAPGGNTANINNSNGTTTISYSGANNSATVNGDATNTITLGGGNGLALVGFNDDDNFGYTASVTLSGNNNVVSGGSGAAGDENFTITGGANSNTIALGDGNSSVTLLGSHNTVSVGGGNNSIDTGGSNATVLILGEDLDNTVSFPNDPEDTPYVTSSPTDYVTIRGTLDSVTATYENVVVIGLSVTSAATINLGNGNNNVTLGGSGGNTVTLGDGGNSINASGNGSTYTVGSGANTVTLSGNNNNIVVNDLLGVGTDTIQLGVGTGDFVSFGYAGGSVLAWAPFGTTTTVLQAGPRSVTVNLHGGTGIILLGDGNDSVTANGNTSTVILGNGNNIVQANGAMDTVVAGDGNNKVTANGNNTSVTLGNGNNTVTANGSGVGAPPQESIVVGNGNNTITANGSGVDANTGTQITAGSGTNTITANGNWAQITVGIPSASPPNGNLTLSATGSHDTIVVNASASSLETVNLGSNDFYRQTSGSATITGVAGDTFKLNGLIDSTMYENGNNNLTFLGKDSSVLVHLNPANSGDVLTVQGDAGKVNSGVVEISGFGNNDVLDLQGLKGGVTHTDFSTLSGAALMSAVLGNMNFGPTGDTLALVGGGSIKFDAPVAAFTVASFVSSATTGPV